MHSYTCKAYTSRLDNSGDFVLIIVIYQHIHILQLSIVLPFIDTHHMNLYYCIYTIAACY